MFCCSYTQSLNGTDNREEKIIKELLKKKKKPLYPKARVFKVKEPTECKRKETHHDNYYWYFRTPIINRKSSKLLDRRVGLSTRIRLVTDYSSTTLIPRKLGSTVC